MNCRNEIQTCKIENKISKENIKLREREKEREREREANAIENVGIEMKWTSR